MGRSNYVIFHNYVLKIDGDYLRDEANEKADGDVDDNNFSSKTSKTGHIPVRRYNGADITPFATTQYYNPKFGLPKDNVNNELYWKWLEHRVSTFLLAAQKKAAVW